MAVTVPQLATGTSPLKLLASSLMLVTWSPFVVGCAALLGTVIVWQHEPVRKPFFIFNSSLSGPVKDDTFSVPVQMGVTLLITLSQLIAADFCLMRRLRDRTLRITSFVQAIVHLWCIFWMVSCMQQFFSIVTGKQRPDFIATCNPNAAAFSDGNLPFYTQGKDFRAFYSVQYDSCQGDSSDIDDASKSFFSGHASSTTVLIVFSMLHFYYTLYLRAPLPSRNVQPTLVRVICDDLLKGLRLLWTGAQLLWVFGMAMSRYVDNKHHVDDICFGLIVGALFACFGFIDFVGVQRELLSMVSALPDGERLHKVPDASAIV